MHSKSDHYKLHQNERNDEFWIVDCVDANVDDEGNYKMTLFLILNFRRVLIVVSFLLGKSPASVY